MLDERYFQKNPTRYCSKCTTTRCSPARSEAQTTTSTRYSFLKSLAAAPGSVWLTLSLSLVHRLLLLSAHSSVEAQASVVGRASVAQEQRGLWRLEASPFSGRAHAADLEVKVVVD